MYWLFNISTGTKLDIFSHDIYNSNSSYPYRPYLTFQGIIIIITRTRPWNLNVFISYTYIQIKYLSAEVC